MPRDKLALTMNDSKDYPDRARLIEFIRHVTGKSERSAASIIEQVIEGAHAAIGQARRYAKRHPDLQQFAEKLTAIMQRGIAPHRHEAKRFVGETRDYASIQCGRD
jgi:hypothetical protein